MSAFFVSSTGTGLGKTYMTSLLVRQFKAHAIKPVISGWDDKSFMDTHLLLEAMGHPCTKEAINAISPYRYKAPLSVDQAAALENTVLPYHQLIEFCRHEMACHKRLLIEGAGGIMVPLTQDKTVLDWIKEVQIPVILVVGTYLGTLSHTLTALEVLLMHQVKIAAVMVNQMENEAVYVERTLKSLAQFYPLPFIPVYRGQKDINHTLFAAF